MPGEPIDEYSILLNVDASAAITGMVDAMKEVEEGWDEILKAANRMGDVDLEQYKKALQDIQESTEGELQSALLLDRALEKATETGAKYKAVVIAIADSMKKLTDEQESLTRQATAERIAGELVGLQKAHDLAKELGQAFVDVGRELPFDQLDRFEKKLFDVFKVGINRTRDQIVTFKRMEEITDDAKDSVNKFREEVEKLDPSVMEEIQEQTNRVAQAFLEAGETVPILELTRLENKMIAIAKASEGKFGMAMVFENMREEATKMIGTLDSVKGRLVRIMEVYPPDEVAKGYRVILDVIKEVNEQWREQGKVLSDLGKAQIKNSMIEIMQAAADAGKSATEMQTRITQAGKGIVQSLKPAEQKMNLLAQAGTKLGNIISRKIGIDVVGTFQKLKVGLMKTLKASGLLQTGFAGLAGALGAVAIAATAVIVPLILFVKWSKEGLQIALRNEETHQRLALAVRQHQRALGELSPTQKEAVMFAEELADRFNTAQIEMESLTATALFMTREFKLSTKETFALAEAATVLGISAGVGAESALRSITNFMLTGYTQGLQQLGIFMDEATLFAKAYEMGLVTLTGELDTNAKALAGAALIQEEAAKAAEDATMASQTYAKAIDKARARSDEAKESLGNFFEPLAALWEQIKSLIVVELIKGFMDVIEWAVRATGWITALVKTIGDVAEAIKTAKAEGDLLGLAGAFSGFTFIKQMEENVAIQEEISDRIVDSWDDIGKNAEAGALTAAEAAEELKVKLINAGRGIRKELDKLEEAFREKMAQIVRRYEEAKAKIDLDFTRRRTDAGVSFRRDIADIDQDARESEIDAARDHNEDLINLEEDHKLKMLEIEESFLFEIEDAVRERDARGVLMAQRRHNKEKKEAERQKGLREKQLKKDFVIELAEIERERIRRRAERFEEFMEEQDDLAIQEARRREDAKAARDNAERDLRDAQQRKLDILAAGFLEEFSGTNASLNQLYDLLDAYIGPDGSIEQLYKYIAGVAASTNLSPTMTLASQSGSGALQDPGQTQVSQLVSPFTGRRVSGGQRGKSFFATGPTMFQAGEGLPERVDITPMSQSTGAPRGGFGGGAGAASAVDINLGIGMEHGLIGEIVDQSMDATANVIVSMTKKQRRRARR